MRGGNYLHGAPYNVLAQRVGLCVRTRKAKIIQNNTRKSLRKSLGNHSEITRKSSKTILENHPKQYSKITSKITSKIAPKNFSHSAYGREANRSRQPTWKSFTSSIAEPYLFWPTHTSQNRPKNRPKLDRKALVRELVGFVCTKMLHQGESTFHSQPLGTDHHRPSTPGRKFEEDLVTKPLDEQVFGSTVPSGVNGYNAICTNPKKTAAG